jgi:hypothetical protein
MRRGPGRPLKEDNITKSFSISFRGKEEVALFDKTCQRAKKMDVPVRMVFIAGLQRFVDGEQSIAKLLGNYVQIKRGKVRIRKVRKGHYEDLESFQNDPDYQEWRKGLV